MTETGRILWTPHRKLAESGALPVKVRTAGGVLVGSGVSGQPIDVPPGAYRVAAVMPSGAELIASTLTNVAAGQTVNPRIGLPDDETRSRMTSRANPPVFQMQASISSLIETSMDLPQAGGREVIARHWRGTWLGDWRSPEEALLSGLQETELTLTETEQVPLFADDDHDRFLITSHTRASDGHVILRFSIVPHDECIVCVGEPAESRLILATIREGSDPPAIKYASSISSETNVLLNFVDAGVLGEMQTVSAAFIGEGKNAMLQARVSLLRGLTGAYVMLRANTLDGMGEWLAQLGEMAPLLPDTYTLQAELLARAGRHQEAVLSLKRATHALCPWFRAGVSYLLERLRLYTELDDETKATLGLTPDDWAQFSHARKRLERMAPMLVVSQIFTTFDIPK
jgi:hypothetical protein